MGIFDFFKKRKTTPKRVVKDNTVNSDFSFGKVNLKNVEDYYDETIEINGRKIRIDLNFEKDSITQKELDEVYIFVEKIEGLNMINKEYIKRDFKKTPSVTADYLDYYIEELEERELAEIIDLSSTTAKPILLMEKLKLNRVGIYPEASHFATFDYSIDIDGEPCNQLLVVNIHENGGLDYITWES